MNSRTTTFTGALVAAAFALTTVPAEAIAGQTSYDEVASMAAGTTKESGAIGRPWKAAGYERGYGYPVTDEFTTQHLGIRSEHAYAA